MGFTYLVRLMIQLKSVPGNKTIAWVILSILFIYACIILLLSSGTYDAGDGVTHYLISRYSWQHPYLFMDDWGKPFFTIISSPFAQFGLKGITFFNILCGLSASYLAFLIAEKLTIPFPYLAIIFTFSAPIYFSVVNSGLTEPLFSLMLMLCIWLILNKRYYLSAIIFSFLPYVRPEYVFLLPIFMFYYVLKKKYLANFLLPAGTIIISVTGFFHYKSFFWLINQNPYSQSHSQTYGSVHGDLLSYIGQYHDITGVALLILIISGILWFAGAEYFKKSVSDGAETNYFFEETFLIFGGFVALLSGHTLVWATGIFPTLGLSRYMAPLIPLAAIIALRGLQVINLVPDYLKLNRLKTMIAAIFTLLILYSPYTLWYKIPFTLGPEDVVIKKAADWLKQTSNADKKLFYEAPYVTICLDIDRFNMDKSTGFGALNSNHPDQNMPRGSIMIWDSHFGLNEGKIGLDTLMKDTNLTLLRKFDPDEKFTVIGGMDYGIWIFQKK